MKNCKQDLLLPSGQCSSDLERCKRENCNQWQPMTNYDRIRNMSVEEFSRFLKKISDCEDNLCNECPITCCSSAKGLEQWLKSEETEDIKQWLESEVDTE